MKLTTLEAIISLKESSQVEYKKAKNDFPQKMHGNHILHSLILQVAI